MPPVAERAARLAMPCKLEARMTSQAGCLICRLPDVP